MSAIGTGRWFNTTSFRVSRQFIDASRYRSLKAWIDVRGRVKMSRVGLLDADAESCWTFNCPNPDYDWQHISYRHEVNLRENPDSYEPL
jgi:hypothetical protein